MSEENRPDAPGQSGENGGQDEPDGSSWVGRYIGPYEVLEDLGMAAVGVVARGYDSRHERQVVLHVLPAPLLDRPGARERLIGEARGVATIDHPNIGVLHEVVEDDDGTLALVFAHLDGETLRRVLGRGPLLAVPALYIVRQIAEGLAAAHLRGIAHGAIEPGNVFVTHDGEVKILSFGVGGVLPTDTPSLERWNGTVGYLAPERFRGEAPDPRADLWSLGVVLYEMLTGARPFEGDGPTSVMRAVLDREPLPVDPPAAEEVVEELLVKDPEDRLQSAAEAVEAVDRAADRIAAELGGDVAADPRRYWVPAPAVYGSAGLGLLLIVVGIWMALRPGPGATGGLAADRVAVLPFEVQGGPDVAFLREGVAELLSVRLQGAGGLHSVDPNTLLARVGGTEAVDADLGRRVAVDAGAARFVIGDVVQREGRIRIEAAYFTPRSGDDPAGRVAAEGEVERVFDLVDELAVAMIARGLAHPEETPISVASITTASLPALRTYLRGERALREGRFREALEAFGGAVGEDSLFALAEHRAHVAASWGSRPGRAAEAAARAARRPGRLPSVERRLTEGDLSWPRGLLARAETLYVEVLRERPSSAEGWYDLGELYFHTNPLRGRPFTQAREPYQRVNALTAYDHFEALARLADLAAHDRRLADHDSLYARLDPARLTRVRRAVAAFSTGGGEARAAMMEELRRGPADTVAIVADHLAGITLDLADAVQVVELLTAPDRPEGWRAVGHLRAALYEVGRGRWASASDHLDAAEALAPDEAIRLRAHLWALPFAPYDEAAIEDARASLLGWDANAEAEEGVLPETFGAGFLAPLAPALKDYLLGALAARLGDAGEVERAAGTLAARTGETSSDSLVRELGADLRARVTEDPAVRVRLLLGSGPDFGRPLEEVSRSPYHSRTVARFLLAETLFGIGRLDEATRWYESFLGGPLIFDVPSQGPARLRLGAIHEARGRPAEAARQYRAVLDLWSDADETLAPWLDVVRDRLAALEEG